MLFILFVIILVLVEKKFSTKLHQQQAVVYCCVLINKTKDFTVGEIKTRQHMI